MHSTITQFEITLPAMPRGFHLVTARLMRLMPPLPRTGLVNIFVKHTGCGLAINENCDPDVRTDMQTVFDSLVKENDPRYRHTLEGPTTCPLM